MSERLVAGMARLNLELFTAKFHDREGAFHSDLNPLEAVTLNKLSGQRYESFKGLEALIDGLK